MVAQRAVEATQRAIEVEAAKRIDTGDASPGSGD
jgi:hypothetical protein